VLAQVARREGRRVLEQPEAKVEIEPAAGGPKREAPNLTEARGVNGDHHAVDR
jgi:hypothetical protein